jgi:TPR repeat protein
MKYDDAEYCFLNFETDRLPNEAGGTHTGMYLAWAASKGLLDWDFDEEVLAPLRARSITGSQLFFDRCDGKLTDDDLNDVGNAFTASYYEAHFVADYQRVFADQIPNGGETTDDFCSVPDTWENYDRLAPLLDERFAQWKQSQAPSQLAPPGPGRTADLPPEAAVPGPAESVDALRARAEAGDHEAWFDLGVQYLTGERVPKDMAKAADAFLRGAERGSSHCQFNLGVCFQHGDGRPKDEAKALHWFSQAANDGHAEGLFQLAMALRTGRGAPQDPVAANAVMLLAQSRGSEDARREGVTAGTLSESVLLLEKIRQPGQLLVTLALRRRDPGLLGGAADAPRAADAHPAAPSQAAPPPGGRVGVAPVVALLVGAAGFILLLLAAMAVKGTALQGIALLLGAVSAFGAYRCSLGLEKSAGMSALLAVLAFVPVVGSFVCLALVLQILRRHGSR